MIEQAIVDWDDAYENGKNIVGGADYPALWQERSAIFRQHSRATLDIAYGKQPRQMYDMFLPDASRFPAPRGLFVFVHGGYWQRTDKSVWSYLAKGPVDLGWAVAIPSYVLCPEASIADIQRMISDAIDHAAQQIDGPIVLAGHSAGGHLVQSMMCQTTGLKAAQLARLKHVLSISGLADLRPLLRTKLNDALQLDQQSAVAASPVFQEPLGSVPLTAWVGAGERAEFIRQNALIANIWHGLGARTRTVEEPDRHHFNVIDALCDAKSSMLQSVIGGE